MINELDKTILERINFSNSYLKILSKYVKNRDNIPQFKKKEVMQVFKETNYDCKYVTGGAYVISKERDNYKFDLSFVISHNSPHIYIYVYKDNNLLDRGIKNFSFTLNFLEFDRNLLNNNFGLNSLNDLKSYIMRMVDLFNEYVDEFVSQIKD